MQPQIKVETQSSAVAVPVIHDVDSMITVLNFCQILKIHSRQV